MSLIACLACGTQNDADRRFCVECGNRLSSGCAVCGTVNPPDAKFCGQCGNNLAAPGGLAAPGERGAPGGLGLPGGVGAPAPVVPAALAAPIAERRLVSVVFVDLVGFTTASEGRDAEDTRDLLTRYYDSAREIVSRYGGTIEKFIGDAVMAVWGTPSAHEDDAERAVRAALELVNAVPRIEGAGPLLQARAGVLTGEAAVSIGLVGQGMIAGDLVNTASRLQSAARPGTVLVGEATYRAASRAIAFEHVGEKELKGKEHTVEVWEAVGVVARRGGEGRSAMLEPPFVGRDDELQLLKDLFHATAREGKPRLVTLAGVAGIGKSRVLWEFEKYLDGVVENVFWHAGRSPSYGEGISYWALAEMVRGRAGIAKSDDQATARERVRETVGGFVADEAERRWIEPRLLGLLGLEPLPGESREELFAAWRTFFERIADQSPVILGFWDLQWADQGMLDFVEHLLAWARSSPILVFAEARPELFDRRPDWGRAQRSATLMHLGPLAETDMRGLLAGLVPDLPPEPMRRIVDRAEGVPLYAVETLRMLLDRGVIEARGSHFTLNGELPELVVPETLHALIAARLDSLPPEERGLLADGSVLGLSFTLPALVAVAHLPPDTVNDLVDALIRRELLIHDVDPRSSERGQHRFLQGVVREIAYQSLAKKSRQAKHLAAARHFESLAEEDLAVVRASHYLAAFQATSPGPEADALAAQARVALRAAADRASALHDLVGALASLEQALLVTPDPVERASLHERALVVGGDAAEFGRALDHGEQAVSLYQERGDRLGVVRTRARQATVHHMEHHDQLAITMLRELIADAADLGPTPEIALAQTELARALMLSGSSVEAVAWCDRVLAHPDVAAPDVLLEALITKGTALQNDGRVVEAEALLRGAIAIADAGTNLAAGLRARNNLRVLVQWTDLRQALALSHEVRDIALKFGVRSWVLHGIASSMDVTYRLGDWEPFDEATKAEIANGGEFYDGWFELESHRRQTYLGDPRAEEREFDLALTRPVIANSAQATTWNLAAKADALIAQGRFDEAFDEAERGRAASAENELGLLAGLFAAAGAGDPERIGKIRELIVAFGGERVPAGRGYIAAADSLVAALGGRWTEARSHLLAARQLLEEVGEGLALGRFHLAIGHLAENRFAEADESLARATAWFAELGAAGYVDAYRAAAARPVAGIRAAPEPVPGLVPDVAVAEPVESVRTAG